MSAFFNISSLFLGLISWVIPVFALLQKKNPSGAAGISFLCCTLALLLQLMEIRNRVIFGDLTAVMDTISAVVTAGAVMIAVCTALNLLGFLRNRK